MFKFHEVNRITTTPESINRIKAISKSMTEDGLLLHPIIVTSKFYIIDGQHRLKAALKAGKGIYYVIDYSVANTPKAIYNAARRYNQSAKVWSKFDYVHGLSVQGNENYQTIEDFREKYPMFSFTENLLLLRNSGSKNPSKTSFAEGGFKIASLKKAETWANFLLDIKPYFEKGYNKSNFVRAMLDILEKKPEFDTQKFMHKLKLRPGSIYLCGDKKQYTEMIENIYNYRTSPSEKINLRF